MAGLDEAVVRGELDGAERGGDRIERHRRSADLGRIEALGLLDRRLPDIDVDIAVDHWIGDDRVGAELRLIGFDELLVLRIVDRLEVVQADRTSTRLNSST